MKPEKQSILKNQEGFTLVEIIAVLIILGILAAVAVPRYIDLEANARDRAIDAAISELNGRENLHWANTKIGTGGWVSDADLFGGADPMDTVLGDDYTWTVAASTTGGTLCFKCPTDGSGAVALDRDPSTNEKPAVWTRTP